MNTNNTITFQIVLKLLRNSANNDKVFKIKYSGDESLLIDSSLSKAILEFYENSNNKEKIEEKLSTINGLLQIIKYLKKE